MLKTDDQPPVGYGTDEQGYAYVGHGDALVAVVVGRHFPLWQKPGARELCDRAGVSLLRCGSAALRCFSYVTQLSCRWEGPGEAG